MAKLQYNSQYTTMGKWRVREDGQIQCTLCYGAGYKMSVHNCPLGDPPKYRVLTPEIVLTFADITLNAWKYKVYGKCVGD